MDIYLLIAFDPGAGDRNGEEVAGRLEDAGFQNTRAVPLPTPRALVTAEKPSASSMADIDTARANNLLPTET